jgi:hypothetical protein
VSVTFAGRTLDQVTLHRPESLNYLVGDRLTPVPVRSQFWTPGKILDQGREGACTGFAASADAAASPVRVKGVDDRYAQAWYRRAQLLDEWPGEAYEGSSVNATMAVMRERGLIREWWWCKTIEELVQAIIQVGPSVIGVPWREGMYETRPDGLVEVTGRIISGHALLVNGYSPKYAKLGEVFRWQNSWGPGYGKNGHGYIRLDAFQSLAFTGNGEVAVSVGRQLPTQRQLALAA